jgi:hypothetical protein
MREESKSRATDTTFENLSRCAVCAGVRGFATETGFVLIVGIPFHTLPTVPPIFPEIGPNSPDCILAICLSFLAQVALCAA